MNVTPKSAIHVTHYERKPKKESNFSIEKIFENLRNSLSNKIEFDRKVCFFENNGFASIAFNILVSYFRKSRSVSHITGEVHYIAISLNKKKTILTIHDCGMVHRKKGIQKKLVTWLYIKMPVAFAKYVTCVSETTKAEIIQLSNCDPKKVIIIPVAIHPMFTPHPKNFLEDKPVILQIGTTYNKNLVNVIPALEGLNVKFIIIGKLNVDQLNDLAKFKIDFENYVNISGEEMLNCYIKCDILAFVSTFEGFGMPIIEANFVERAVLTSNISSMPEVAGEAALLVDPYSVKSIRQGITTLIDNAQVRTALIENGRANRLRFSAEKITAAYYELYKTLS